MTLSEKIIQHKVVLDVNPDLSSFTGIPQWVSLDLQKDGEWYCSYMGFLDAKQLDELRSTYEVKEGAVSAEMAQVNQDLRGGHASRRDFEKTPPMTINGHCSDYPLKVAMAEHGWTKTVKAGDPDTSWAKVQTEAVSRNNTGLI
ncbi:MAG: hypothetical protein ABSB35_06840 [Bryobacteraceae bacterium]|jgi:hypothetical protein